MTFEDKPGAELLYLQAASDLHKIVKQDELEHTLGDRHLTIDGDFHVHSKGKVILRAAAVHIVPLNQTGGAALPTTPTELSSGKPASSTAPTGASTLNQSLFKLNPGPMPASVENAKSMVAFAKKYQGLAEKLGKRFHLPPALILAWMNRESSFGQTLGADGWDTFDHEAFGLLQVDKRWNNVITAGGPAGEATCAQAIEEMQGMLKGVKSQHPTWTPEEQLAGALVDYNSGPNNARTEPSTPDGWAAMDSGTAHNNYSRDTWAQAQWYAKNLSWP